MAVVVMVILVEQVIHLAQVLLKVLQEVQDNLEQQNQLVAVVVLLL